MTTPSPAEREEVAEFERRIAADPALQERPAQAALDYAFGLHDPDTGAEQAEQARRLVERLQPIVARYEKGVDLRVDRAEDLTGRS